MNIQYPMFPGPIPYIENNIEKEIIKLKQEINLLKQKINKIEEEKKPNYLQKDDGLYMM